eukprot:2480798-Pyramimonas_sp.AAC.1
MLNAAGDPESFDMERFGRFGNGRSFMVERCPRCQKPTPKSARHEPYAATVARNSANVGRL